MKVKNPLSQNIRIFPKINQKKDLPNRKVLVLQSVFIYTLNTWSGLLYHKNFSISEVWYGSDQPVALLRHYWAFSSSILLDQLFLVFFLKISHKFHMGFRSGMLVGQSSTLILFITNTSRLHGTPNHHWLWELHTGLQAAWILCLSTLPLDSRPWLPNVMQNFILYEKRILDHWATVHFFFSVAQVRCFWWRFCFRSGLVALLLKMSERGDSWCTDSSFSSLLVKLSQVF